MTDLSRKTILFADLGGDYTMLAEAVVDDYAEVLYWTPSDASFRRARDLLPGIGLAGIERIDDFFDHIDRADLVVFPDVGYAGLQTYLRRQGMPVFGSGDADRLERDRAFLKNVCAQLDIQTAGGVGVRGMEALRSILHTDSGLWVKLSWFRGDGETFEHQGPVLSRDILNEIEMKLGPYGSLAEFVVETPIADDDGPCVEIGFDTFCADGQFPINGLFGYEVKDSAFVGSTAYLSPRMRSTQQKLRPALQAFNYRGAFSTETRENESGTYFIDATCFSDDTEILTEHGWKRFPELKSDEPVATLNKESGRLEYQLPTAYQKFFYEGPMIEFSSPKKVVELLVTPAHGLWTWKASNKTRKTSDLRYSTAATITHKHVIPRTAKWEGLEAWGYELPSVSREWESMCGPARTSHVVRHYNREQIVVNMVPWLKFLGYYLSEGSCKPNGQVDISQVKHLDEMSRELFELPFKMGRYKRGLQFHSVQLSDYLQQFGKCNDKYVPEFVKLLTPRLIRIFLDAYRLGDGTRHKGQNMWFTTSRRMADDLQELVLKAGSVADIRIRECKGTNMKVRDASYIRNHDLYIVTEREKFQEYYFEATGARASQYVNHRPHAGYVYDVTVPNGTVYVRRNGKPVWTSNCRFGSPPSELQSKMITNLGEMLWGYANGEVVEPEFAARYGAQIVLRSSTFEERPIAVQIDRPDRTAIHGHCNIDGVDWAVSMNEIAEMGGAIGLGNTMEEAIAEAQEVAKSIKGTGITYDSGALTKALETVHEGEELGIRWSNFMESEEHAES